MALRMQVPGLGTGITIALDDADQRRLEAMATDRNAAQKHVWRWQERFMAEGVDGLLRDKARPPGKPSVPDDRAAKVVAMTLKPHEATHWTARAMAKAAGLAVSTVQGICQTGT